MLCFLVVQRAINQTDNATKENQKQMMKLELPIQTTTFFIVFVTAPSSSLIHLLPFHDEIHGPLNNLFQKAVRLNQSRVKYKVC